MKSFIKDNDFEPLLGALKKIQFSLESTSSPHVMLAAQTMEEFSRQQLPAHCEVTPRKLRGKRVATRRGRRTSNLSVIARWPQDGLVEGFSPSMLFVLNGEADIDIANYRVHCHAGDVLFLPARIPKLDGSRPHYHKVTRQSHCDLLFLSLLPVGLHSLTAHICHSRADRHEMSGAGESCWLSSHAIYLLFETFSELAQSGGNSKSTFHVTAAMVFLLKQSIEQGKCFSQHDYPSHSASFDDYTPISKAMEYIQNHLDRSLSIDLVARWVGLSRTLFIQQFRAETNESFKAYLTRLRLEEAKVLLRETNISIELISKRVGLSSGQLRNLFHAEYKCTPREFRRAKKMSEADEV